MSDAIKHLLDNKDEQISKLNKQIKIMRDALKFYGDKYNFNITEEGLNYNTRLVIEELNEISSDCSMGAVARKALKQAEEV